jgi:glycosyltransferase involved in cell wall biosynthesis
MTARLSVVIPTCNNQDTLGRTLASAAFADEILVLDSGSTDGTVELARAAGARVVTRPYVSDGNQRNAGYAETQGAWVLALDSDEVLDGEAAGAIGAVVARDPSGAEPVAYSLRFRTYFLGHAIDHGVLGEERHIRLGFRARTRWEDKLHSRLLADGPVGSLPGIVHHYTARTLSSRLTKLSAYAADRARGMRSAGRRASVGGALWESSRFFLGRVFIRGGIRDGLPGVVWWWLQATEIVLAHMQLSLPEKDGEGGAPRE